MWSFVDSVKAWIGFVLINKCEMPHLGTLKCKGSHINFAFWAQQITYDGSTFELLSLIEELLSWSYWPVVDTQGLHVVNIVSELHCV